MQGPKCRNASFTLCYSGMNEEQNTSCHLLFLAFFWFDTVSFADYCCSNEAVGSYDNHLLWAVLTRVSITFRDCNVPVFT